MPIVGFRFRAYTDRRALRALKAQLKLRERRATPFIGQGVQGGSHPWCPWSSAHYPWPTTTGKAGRGSGKPLKGGVAHWVGWGTAISAFLVSLGLVGYLITLSFITSAFLRG